MHCRWLIGLACAVALLGQQPSLDAARRLFAQGSNAQAEAMLHRLVEANPRDAEARQLLGSLLAVEGRRGESLEQLGEVVRLRPQSAAAYNTLGMALSRFVEIKAAREAFQKALEIDPHLAEAHVNLALIEAQDKRFLSAGEHLDRAIERQGSAEPVAYWRYLRAKVFGELGDIENAARELENAVGARPGYAEAWLALGDARRALLDDAGAIAAFERAVELDPRNAQALYLLGSQCLRDGKARAAVVHLKEARRLGLNDQALLYALQRALRMDDQIAEADRVAAETKELLSASGVVALNAPAAVRLNNEGVELEKSGNVRAAVEKYRAALELDPQHGGFRTNYGLALARLGLWEEGIEELREVVRMNPDNAEATRALYIAMEQAARAKASKGTAPHSP